MDNLQADIRKLFALYIDNKLTVKEYNEFLDILNKNEAEAITTAELKILWQKSATDQISLPGAEWNYKIEMLRKIIDTKKEDLSSSTSRRIRIIRWTAAAILLPAISFFVYFLNISNNKINKKDQSSTSKISVVADAKPGGNKAVLLLSDGRQIVLDSAQDGMLATEGNTGIIKQQDGQLVYTAGNAINTIQAFNTLSIPKGGQYKLVLPDGSRVWLNAASLLKYPTAFNHRDRRVQMTGEAYFEIRKDAAKPFIVELNGAQVEVLGTHFNINAYEDEDEIKTTLVQGAVKIKNHDAIALLKPGQQAALKSNGKIKLLNDADTEEALAWKNGNFRFENSDIRSVMRQISRWYNINVEYEGVINKHFGGTISRKVNLSKILNMLEQTGEVNFIINGETIKVTP